MLSLRRVTAPLVALLLMAIVVAALWLASDSRRSAALAYVGSERCGSCHVGEYQAWQRSHHAQAMAPADAAHVRGDFSGESATQAAVAARFHQQDGRYLIDTADTANGPQTLRVAWTFGVEPLQQYLVPGDKGALQAFNLVWDSRPAVQGGQRWFDLNGEQRVTPSDVVHWSQPAQNWNYMCADCHSTGLQKNYDAATQRFDTRWAEVSVGCESCHGQGSAHSAWARRAARPMQRWLAGADPGLPVTLTAQALPARKAAVLDPTRALNFMPGTEVQTCAQCHSRRTQLSNSHVPGADYYDDYKPELLSAALYELDGQQREEDYEWGSFQQSRMFGKGVSCSDCHEPHAARLRTSGNALCLQCHEAALNTPQHSLHDENSTGSQCVNCHMPARTYMRIDARRDHSLRVPRPDLSVSLGVPNACNGCHTDRSAQWAADVIAQAYGSTPHGLQQYAPALQVIRTQAPGAERAIRALAADAGVPDIVKATVLSEAGPYLHNGLQDVVQAGLHHDNPLLRLGALQALEAGEPSQRWQLGAALLHDERRVLRIEAARILGGVPADAYTDTAGLDGAWAEFVSAVGNNADRAEWRSLHAAALAGRGDTQAAVSELQAALKLNPGFIAAYANLADAYREAGDDAACESVLQRGLALAPDDAALHAAYGLLQLRRQQLPAALAEWQQALRSEPGNGTYAWFYASALRTQDAVAARRFLEQRLADAATRDRGQLYLLVELLLENDLPAAVRYRSQLATYADADPQAQALLDALEAAAGSTPR